MYPGLSQDTAGTVCSLSVRSHANRTWARLLTQSLSDLKDPNDRLGEDLDQGMVRMDRGKQARAEISWGDG